MTSIPLLDIPCENHNSKRCVFHSVHSSTIYNSQDIKATQMSIMDKDEWIKKLWYIYMMDSFSATKRNKFEAILVWQMNLEPVIQSEVSQEEKSKLNINRYIWNIERCIDETVCRAAVETQTQRTDLWTQWGKYRVG